MRLIYLPQDMGYISYICAHVYLCLYLASWKSYSYTIDTGTHLFVRPLVKIELTERHKYHRQSAWWPGLIEKTSIFLQATTRWVLVRVSVPPKKSLAKLCRSSRCCHAALLAMLATLSQFPRLVRWDYIKCQSLQQNALFMEISQRWQSIQYGFGFIELPGFDLHFMNI